jgi:hypothetical protein
MAKNTCKHKHTREVSMHGYSGSVAVQPYTYEDRRAHGGVTFTSRCEDCGAERKENSNGRYQEFSPWQLPTEEAIEACKDLYGDDEEEEAGE